MSIAYKYRIYQEYEEEYSAFSYHLFITDCKKNKLYYFWNPIEEKLLSDAVSELTYSDFSLDEWEQNEGYSVKPESMLEYFKNGKLISSGKIYR